MTNNDETCLHDMEWAIGLNRTCLRLIGAWPDDDDDRQHKTKFYDTLIMPLLALSMIFFVFIPQMYALPLVSDDLALIIDNILTSSPTLIGSSKFAILWFNKEVLRPVVSMVQEDWLRNDKEEWERKIMRRSAFIGKSFTAAGFILVPISYLGFSFAPFFGLDMRLATNFTNHGKYPLIFQTYYPFDYSKNLIFELTLFSQLFGGLFVALSATVMPDHYFEFLVYHLSGQFQILGTKLENLFDSDVDKNTFRKHLGVCIDRHAHLMEMVTIVEDAFTFIIMNQVLSLYIYAGCNGIRIILPFTDQSRETTLIEIIVMASFFVSVTTFTFANCLASEILTNHTLEISEKIYNSNWYLFPELPRRDLVVMMAMTKQPNKLTAGKLMDLSLSNFCLILKSIVGYISVLLAALTRQ